MSFVSAANTLDKGDFVWFLTVGLADHFAACGTSCKNQSFELHTGNDVGVFAVAKKRHIIWQVNVETRRNNDCSDVKLNFFRFLVEVYGLPRSTNLGAFEAFDTVILVNGVN
jgi:hypothetical protein